MIGLYVSPTEPSDEIFQFTVQWCYYDAGVKSLGETIQVKDTE